jgi:hypothetical protein
LNLFGSGETVTNDDTMVEAEVANQNGTTDYEEDPVTGDVIFDDVVVEPSHTLVDEAVAEQTTAETILEVTLTEKEANEDQLPNISELYEDSEVILGESFIADVFGDSPMIDEDVGDIPEMYNPSEGALADATIEEVFCSDTVAEADLPPSMPELYKLINCPHTLQ